MEELQEQSVPGHLEFTVYGAGRGGRHRASCFKVRCNAIALHNTEILLLSLVGPETSVKALTAGLRGSGNDQKRIEYSARVGEISAAHLVKCPEGYRIYRTKLNYGLWHVLCLAKRDGFMPVLSEETVWYFLQGDQFTTPLLREWVPWLLRQMQQRQALVSLAQVGCEAGLLAIEDDTLDGPGMQWRPWRSSGDQRANDVYRESNWHGRR